MFFFIRPVNFLCCKNNKMFKTQVRQLINHARRKQHYLFLCLKCIFKKIIFFYFKLIFFDIFRLFG